MVSKVERFLACNENTMQPWRNAVTFFTDETNADKLLADIKAAGIKAEVPAPHICKEEEKNE